MRVPLDGGRISLKDLLLSKEMRLMKAARIIIAGALFLSGAAYAVASTAEGGGPMATLRAKNDRVDTLLRQKSEKEASKQHDQQVKEIAASLLDYQELAHRAMAEHWDSLKPEQQKEFVSTFKEMLEKNYVKQLKSNLDYQVTYKDEKVDGNQATVESVVKVKTKGKSTDAEIVYRMHKVSGGWMVWDIVTDEVSLLRNYKSQFHRIITEQGYDKLLEKMRSKLKEQT
jgi:phospholipid transport system substrate-binding protein